MTVRALAVTDRFSAGVAQCKDPDKVPTFPDGACIAVLLRVFPPGTASSTPKHALPTRRPPAIGVQPRLLFRF